MRKFLLSGAVLIVFSLYALRLNFGDDERPVVAVANTPVSSLTTPQTVEDEPVATLGPTPAGSTSLTVVTPTPKPTGKYKDGTYTGMVADAFYGNIQVQAVISGGRITDIIFLQYPNDRSTSIEINSQAMPLLKQEAIQAQSANVAGVSGATASSDAFIQSLQSALNQAV